MKQVYINVLYSECHFIHVFLNLPAGTHPLTVTNSSHLVGLTQSLSMLGHYLGYQFKSLLESLPLFSSSLSLDSEI